MTQTTLTEDELDWLSVIRNNHFVVGPSLSPDNYSDSSFCGPDGHDPDECEIRFLLDIIDRYENGQ